MCRRVKLFDKDPARQVATYVEAVKTVDPMKAVGEPHNLNEAHIPVWLQIG
jgi:pre-mRNA-splicing factor SYF1